MRQWQTCILLIIFSNKPMSLLRPILVSPKRSISPSTSCNSTIARRFWLKISHTTNFPPLTFNISFINILYSSLPSHQVFINFPKNPKIFLLAFNFITKSKTNSLLYFLDSQEKSKLFPPSFSLHRTLIVPGAGLQVLSWMLMVLESRRPICTSRWSMSCCSWQVLRRHRDKLPFTTCQNRDEIKYQLYPKLIKIDAFEQKLDEDEGRQEQHVTAHSNKVRFKVICWLKNSKIMERKTKYYNNSKTLLLIWKYASFIIWFLTAIKVGENMFRSLFDF